MGASQESNYAFTETFFHLKVTAMENTLKQAVDNFKELVFQFKKLHLENASFKELFHKQKEELESPTCRNCCELKKTVLSKEQIIDSLTTALNRLPHTKGNNLPEEIHKQVPTTTLTPPKSMSPQKENNPKETKLDSTFKSPNKNVVDEICNDESLSEIEGTPTGRRSPILQMKRAKTHSSMSLKDNKKKCSDSWSSPEQKAIKLTYPTPKQGKPGAKLRQGRLSFLKPKSCHVVDLTCSPENSGDNSSTENMLKCNVKKEVIDKDETILPSPTSGPIKLSLYKPTTAKDSPTKFKKPQRSLKLKIETKDYSDHNSTMNGNGKNDEDSINLLNQSNGLKSPMKKEKTEDETHCGDDSISLLHHVNKIDRQNNSPTKRPLAENVNITNVQNHENMISQSVLQRAPTTSTVAKTCDDVTKRVKTNMAPVYKEPTVRKKAEKRALPGWSCDECKNFYDELYKDNPEMLAQKMDECSKHRGRSNPVRPRTPDGFWNPRWDVPQDTEEFNRRNNAL